MFAMFYLGLTKACMCTHHTSCGADISRAACVHAGHKQEHPCIESSYFLFATQVVELHSVLQLAGFRCSCSPIMQCSSIILVLLW